MKFIIDTTKKEILIPEEIKFLEMLELVTVLNADTEDYTIDFYEDLIEDEDEEEHIPALTTITRSSSGTNPYDPSIDDYLQKYYGVNLTEMFSKDLPNTSTT